MVLCGDVSIGLLGFAGVVYGQDGGSGFELRSSRSRQFEVFGREVMVYGRLVFPLFEEDEFGGIRGVLVQGVADATLFCP